jgi:alkanesulfonate monooxygenase SsuD/methylene tetrahydromethanopterin reductase-like flavin-dependent oxidoreductase (luciferase family)
MGIGPGGLPSDFELFGLDDPLARGKMTLESIDTILKIWSIEPPYRIEGEYWQIRQDEWYWPEFGLGFMPKPLQQPHPPIAIAGMSPYPFFVKEAAKRGWIAVSANFIPAASAATHWQRYVEGCEEAGIEPDGANWRLARTWPSHCRGRLSDHNHRQTVLRSPCNTLAAKVANRAWVAHRLA